MHLKLRKFSCKYCGSTFKRHRQLQTHIIAAHDFKFFCEICEIPLSNQNSYDRHVELIHEKKKPFHCPSCPSKFGQKDKLHNHILSVHEGKKDYKCVQCEKAFSLKTCLKRHVQQVHQKLPCDLCGKFISQFNRKKHMKIKHSDMI